MKNKKGKGYVQHPPSRFQTIQPEILDRLNNPPPAEGGAS